MQPVKGYFDYCITEQCFNTPNFEKSAKTLVDLGYHTIAINQVIDEANLEPKKKKKKGEPRDVIDIVPTPFDVKSVVCEDIKILNRLTVIFSNQELINKISKSPNFKKYDILAVLPTSQQAFQFVCSTMEADILSFDPETRLNYKLNRRLYNQLVERGFYFEILYSPAIQDSSQRKNIINIAHMYHVFGKSRNIIVSSGATNSFLFRNPYDVINLSLLFGLNEQQAKNCILQHGRKLYINAVGRRLGKSVMFVENTEKASSDTMEVESEEDEEMESDQPAQKKSKQ